MKHNTLKRIIKESLQGKIISEAARVPRMRVKNAYSLMDGKYRFYCTGNIGSRYTADEFIELIQKCVKSYGGDGTYYVASSAGADLSSVRSAFETACEGGDGETFAFFRTKPKCWTGHGYDRSGIYAISCYNDKYNKNRVEAYCIDQGTDYISDPVEWEAVEALLDSYNGSTFKVKKNVKM